MTIDEVIASEDPAIGPDIKEVAQKLVDLRASYSAKAAAIASDVFLLQDAYNLAPNKIVSALTYLADLIGNIQANTDGALAVIISDIELTPAEEPVEEVIEEVVEEPVPVLVPEPEPDPEPPATPEPAPPAI